jgi:electron transfer flavoprotein alpha subunit
LWVFAEQRGGRTARVTFELLGVGRELADRMGTGLGTVLLGADIAGLTQELIDCGADTVFLGEDPGLEPYATESYVSAMAGLLDERSPEIILFGATTMGRDLTPRLAARVSAGLTSDCVRLNIDEDGVLLQEVLAFGGEGAITIVCPEHRPQMTTIRSGVYSRPAAASRKGEIVVVEPSLPEDDGGVKVLEFQPKESTGGMLEEADTVVAGGWGINNLEGWALLQELAETLNAEVGATRPALDEGWAVEEQMIGQSGIYVRPRLYIGVGISGVMHHTVGIQDAKVIVAINNDPKAEIFKYADLVVVEDFRLILPELIKALKA